MLNEKEQKIVDMVTTGGPILPITVSKSLGVETFLAGAMLSSLVKNGHLKISQKRIGSSPLYYKSGQERKVQEMLYKELNDLEQKALERIRNLKVATDSELYPQERFLLKSMADFVTPLTVKHGDKEISIWKHNSVSEQELNEILKVKLTAPPKEEQKLPEKLPEPAQLPAQPESHLKLVEAPPKTKTVHRKPKQPSEFVNRAKQYLKDIKAEIIEEKPVKRDEHFFTIELPTVLGRQNFLVKAKDKKAVSESELSQFYLECMNAKKPGILLVPSELNKKTSAFAEKNVGKMIKVIVI
jgi:hypothetical protein